MTRTPFNQFREYRVPLQPRFNLADRDADTPFVVEEVVFVPKKTIAVVCMRCMARTGAEFVLYSQEEACEHARLHSLMERGK